MEAVDTELVPVTRAYMKFLTDKIQSLESEVKKLQSQLADAQRATQ